MSFFPERNVLFARIMAVLFLILGILNLIANNPDPARYNYPNKLPSGRFAGIVYVMGSVALMYYTYKHKMEDEA